MSQFLNGRYVAGVCSRPLTLWDYTFLPEHVSRNSHLARPLAGAEKSWGDISPGMGTPVVHNRKGFL